MMRIVAARYRLFFIVAITLVLTLILSDTTWTGNTVRPSPDLLMAQTNIEKKKGEILKRFNKKKGNARPQPGRNEADAGGHTEKNKGKEHAFRCLDKRDDEI